ncbi:MAG: hypothetical protein JW774_04180 [Candidatus Aureabacteria bacterium]|nr:hypothetical protein [Candidatus Auribacterota bacterium]
MRTRKFINKGALLALVFLFMVSGKVFAAGKGDALSANIPQIYGKAKDTFKGSSDKTVIHIQDAHGNVESQENIQAIIKSLEDQGKKVDAIMDEGGWLEYETKEIFKDFSAEDKTLLGDWLTKYGLIHGADRAVIFDNPDMPIYGAEDYALYRENGKVMKEACSNKKDSMAITEKIKGVMEAIKLKLFDEASRNFLQAVDDFNADRITLTAFSKTLQTEADKAGVKWANYNNFNKVAESITLEDSIDFAKIDRERLDLTDEIQAKADKKVADEIVTESLNYRLGKLSASDYYNALLKKAETAKADMTKYGNVQKYAQLVNLYAGINDDALFAELKNLEKEIKSKLFKSDAQINFDKYSTNLDILNKMIGLQMTVTDLAYYKDNKAEVSAAKMIAFLKDQAKTLNLAVDLQDSLAQVDKKLSANEKFYELALKRDEIMIEKTLAMMDEKGFKTVVLVAGGFHTEGITKALKAKAISHMIVTPRITNPDAPNYWLQNSTGEETEATKLLKANGLDYATLYTRATPPLSTPTPPGTEPVTPPRKSETLKLTADILRRAETETVAAVGQADMDNVKAAVKASDASQVPEYQAGLAAIQAGVSPEFAAVPMRLEVTDGLGNDPAYDALYYNINNTVNPSIRRWEVIDGKLTLVLTMTRAQVLLAGQMAALGVPVTANIGSTLGLSETSEAIAELRLLTGQVDAVGRLLAGQATEADVAAIQAGLAALTPKAVSDSNIEALKSLPNVHHVLLEAMELLNGIRQKAEFKGTPAFDSLAQMVLQAVMGNEVLQALPADRTLKAETARAGQEALFTAFRNAALLALIRGGNNYVESVFTQTQKAIVQNILDAFNSDVTVIREDASDYKLLTDEAEVERYVSATPGAPFGISKELLAKKSIVRAVNDTALAEQALKRYFNVVKVDNIDSIDDGLEAAMAANATNTVILISNKVIEAAKDILAKKGPVKVFLTSGSQAQKILMAKDKGKTNVADRTYFSIDHWTMDTALIGFAQKAIVGNAEAAQFIADTNLFETQDVTTILAGLQEGNLPKVAPQLQALFDAMSVAAVFGVAA